MHRVPAHGRRAGGCRGTRTHRPRGSLFDFNLVYFPVFTHNFYFLYFSLVYFSLFTYHFNFFSLVYFSVCSLIISVFFSSCFPLTPSPNAPIPLLALCICSICRREKPLRRICGVRSHVAFFLPQDAREPLLRLPGTPNKQTSWRIKVKYMAGGKMPSSPGVIAWILIMGKL